MVGMHRGDTAVMGMPEVDSLVLRLEQSQEAFGRSLEQSLGSLVLLGNLEARRSLAGGSLAVDRLASRLPEGKPRGSFEEPSVASSASRLAAFDT